MTDVQTDVLIVGSGPAGGSMALALSTYGIHNIVVTQYHRLVRTPRAHITNQRCMEILRDMGVEHEVVAQATPQELMGNNVFCESLAGEELGRLYSWQNHPLSLAEALLASPTRICDMPQNLMEPILINNATQRGTHLRYSTEYVSHVQDDDGVTATVRDRMTGHEYRIRAKYLYGADGGNSAVAENAGLTFEGQMGVAGSINIVFDADLSDYVAHRPSVLYWVLQPGADVGGIGMGLIRMVRPWHRWLVIWGYDINESPPEVDDTFAIDVVRSLVGVPDLEVDIDSWSLWTVNDMYATTNTDRRVFCGGDATHRHPPSNGLGSNTSIQDSYNLAWKLAHVLNGHADPSLLVTYQEERIPIARQIVTRANKSIEEFGPIFESLGMLGAGDAEELRAAMQTRKEDSPGGAQAREALRTAVALKNYEFNALGVDLNHRYTSTAVVDDGSPDIEFPRDPELHHHRTTRPGAKVPHCWFRRGPHSREVLATLDLVGQGRFTVLTGIGGEAWVEAADAYTAATGVPIATVVIGPGRDVEDIYGEWPEVREISETGCLVVRPDGYVGFRAAAVSDDAGQSLRTAMDQILRRT